VVLAIVTRQSVCQYDAMRAVSVVYTDSKRFVRQSHLLPDMALIHAQEEMCLFAVLYFRCGLT
jgi:hypothetical protein